MSNPGRREFLKNSMALALAPAAENALRAPVLLGEPEPGATTSRGIFSKALRREQIKTSGATINTVYGGNGKGPPLLLLHGIPETHVLWRKVAPALAQDYFLVMPDLRGYGDSGKPPGGDDHAAYSKRAMAQDQVEVMKHLGFQKFAVVGHDRGGRAAHRMALDYPELSHQTRDSRYCADLSALPEYYSGIRHDFLPLVSARSAASVSRDDGGQQRRVFSEVHFALAGRASAHRPDCRILSGPAVFQEYFRTFREPATIHAICEDYRAAASIDLAHDKADLDKKIQCPLLVLWSEKGPFHRMYNVLQTWRDRAVQAQGKAMPTGPFSSGADAGGIDARTQNVSAELSGYVATGFTLSSSEGQPVRFLPALHGQQSHRLKPVPLERVASRGPCGIKRLPSHDRIKIVLFAPGGQWKSVTPRCGRGPI